MNALIGGMMLRRLITSLLAMLCLSMAQPYFAESGYGFLPQREYEGQTYVARPCGELTTVLLIGYDHEAEGQLEELHGFSNGGQADFLLLVVMDHRYDQIRTLQIDRDTMTDVRVTDARGNQHDRSNLQICLAHAYGNTREANNANTVLAVENLLGIGAADDGVAIDFYVAMDISGISRLNDLLGGVTLTITQDLTQIDPAMTPGAIVTLNGTQAERFCRGRMGIGDQTNASRMARQRQYMTAAAARLTKLLRQDVNFGIKLLDGMGVIYDMSAPEAAGYSFAAKDEGTPAGSRDGYWVMTDMQRKTIIAELSRAVEYTLLPTETLAGEHSLGSNGYIRYDLEEDAAIRWALDVFYRTEQ